MHRILVVDDRQPARSAIAAQCRALGHGTLEASEGREARSIAHAERPDVVLLDLVLPADAGLEHLQALVALDPAPAVVMVTGDADVATAVRAMRLGAADVLEKPIRGGALRAALAGIFERRARSHGRPAAARPGAIIGASAPIRDVLVAIERVAATPRTTVLITGPSGTGKELVARAIHERSQCASGPFVAVNCAALSSALLEAELFGYEGGAFTGARPKGHDGLIAAAESGSLFLDEIGELAPALQAKLLRVLQERVYRRVGGNADRGMDARILASTNRDLPAMVAAGTFREDLYYRLNVMSIRVPALSERAEDVPLLVEHFIARFEREFNQTFAPLDPAVLERLAKRPWPGNVRELSNTIERAALLAEAGRIEIGEPAPDARGAAGGLPLEDRSLAGVERALILRVLAETEGNRSRAARILGVNRTTLYNKLHAYGIVAV